jgi:integrase
MSKRRGQNEGSIYHLSDGRWRAAISLGYKVDEKGKRVPIRKTLNAHSRKEVQEQLNNALRDHQRGFLIDTRNPTLKEFLTAWLSDVVMPTVRWKTYRSYEQMVRNHLVKDVPSEEWTKRKLDAVEGLGATKLAKLSLQDMQRFMKAKLDAGNSPALVRYLRVVLRAALAHAASDNLVYRNVAALAKPPRVEKREMKSFDANQARRFLDAAIGHRLEALFTAGLSLGLRSGEALGLMWSELDLERAEVRISHALQRVRGELVRVEVKSEKGKRTIPLPPTCTTALKQHRERQEVERQWAAEAWKETGFVFTTTIGTPLDDRNVLRAFDALLSAAKLPKIRIHDLRHTCVSLLAAQGVPVKTISEIIGHSDIRLTQNVYQHVFKEAKQGAAAAMERALNPVATKVATKEPDKQSEKPLN